MDVNALVELVADGFQWSEGPVFVVNEQHPGSCVRSPVPAAANLGFASACRLRVVLGREAEHDLQAATR